MTKMVWSQGGHIKRHLLYMDKVKVEALGPTLCLLSEFLAAISPDFFRKCIIIWKSHQA